MISFQQLNDRYLETHLKGRASYVTFRQIHRQHFDWWDEHPTKALIRQWHRLHAATPAHSNKGLAYLKALYNWAINEELWDGENPALGIRRHRTFSREITMTNQEVAHAMAHLPEFYWKMRGLFVVLLTTGCRLGEALRMQWAHVDLVARVWVKPITKNGRSQRVPLPWQTCEVLRTMKQEGAYVLMGMYGHHLSRTAAEKHWTQIREMLRIPHIRIHDLRRTVASRLLDQGEDGLVIKAILNHYQGDVTSVYARASFDTQAVALQTHADTLWRKEIVP